MLINSLLGQRVLMYDRFIFMVIFCAYLRSVGSNPPPTFSPTNVPAPTPTAELCPCGYGLSNDGVCHKCVPTMYNPKLAGGYCIQCPDGFTSSIFGACSCIPVISSINEATSILKNNGNNEFNSNSYNGWVAVVGFFVGVFFTILYSNREKLKMIKSEIMDNPFTGITIDPPVSMVTETVPLQTRN